MTEVTRGEFDMLKQMVSDQATRLTAIDDHGTRGVGIVQAQLVDVIKDLQDLQTSVNAKFTAHELVHEKEEAQRKTDRRWRIGTALTALGAIGGLYGWLFYLLPHH